MSLSIREITKENWRQIACLTVTKGQHAFIESNAFSIAQSGFEPEWVSCGLYDKDIAVGYAMHGIEVENGRIWLDRFMIDVSHQGKGYAKKFLHMLVEEMCRRYSCTRIYLSIHPENEFARKLYESFGFTSNGEMDGPEEVMVLDLTNE
ncbi:GNAT family N-acetyltransferase [Brevibacillus formosus]|uniref:GNAT family N-acetyltransferase n=1 Tax=Brevibacillus TaxID=55080 RepID=UPI000D0F5C50|nr:MULTISPECIES: GNAT family N-acetyltransferase [Brevibacillus]MBG9944437.1 spermidine acetyltransferase [Brevibacillus formosus]MED1946329.1 GNAT family N-acetyltransferase [Brevibacillus formosus]MED1998749.1 GNAT family N-acetyltransferase [Brevibacillus formosus]MED2084194.1 GNAT family N-acetyltransferase [Brevibacillus formosus]PSK18223.1 spermidine acetyltransferase [Brevibacillus sp. NRRL NRS-603]